MSEAAPAPGLVRAFLSAVQFLTRVPVPSSGANDPESAASDLRRGLVFLPVIGGAIGAVTGIALLVLSVFLPFSLAVLGALAIEVRLTGALHEDAVADVADAFGGGATRDDVLRILKDSRVGTYGVLALGFAVALRAAALIDLEDTIAAAIVLIVSSAVGRLAILAVLALVPPLEGRTSLANQIASPGDWSAVLMGAAIASPVAALGVWLDFNSVLLALVGIVLFLVWYRALLMRRLGGVTGDCLGFAAYAGILIATLAFCRLGA